MKPNLHISKRKSTLVCMIALLVFVMPFHAVALNNLPTLSAGEMASSTEYKGKIIDKKTGTSLAFASILVVGLNISTI